MSWLISRISAFAYRNYIFAIRNFFTMTEIFFWPVIGIISIGIMSGFLNLEPHYMNFLLAGAVISGVLQVSQLDVAYGFLYDVWSKSTKQTYIAPVRNYDMIIGSWLIGAARGIIAFAGLAVLAGAIFKFNLPELKYLIPSLAGVYLTAMIIGIVVILSIMTFGQRIDIIAWMLSVLMMLICGIYYPVTYLPAWLMKIAESLPLTYFLEYFRAGYGFELTFSHTLAKGFALSFVYIFVLFLLIEAAYRRAKRTGMLIRLSE